VAAALVIGVLMVVVQNGKMEISRQAYTAAAPMTPVTREKISYWTFGTRTTH
jgi:hypothetical protein